MKKKHLVILELKRSRFHQCKSPFLIDNKDINKIVVSNKISFGKKSFKYFIGYKNDLKSYTIMYNTF